MVLYTSVIVDSKGRCKHLICGLPATLDEVKKFNGGDEDVKGKFQKLASFTCRPESERIVRSTPEVVWNGGQKTTGTSPIKHRESTSERKGNTLKV